MQYEIEVTKHFERLLRKLDPEVMKRIRDKILELKIDPYASKPLIGGFPICWRSSLFLIGVQ